MSLFAKDSSQSKPLSSEQVACETIHDLPPAWQIYHIQDNPIAVSASILREKRSGHLTFFITNGHVAAAEWKEKVSQLKETP